MALADSAPRRASSYDKPSAAINQSPLSVHRVDQDFLRFAAASRFGTVPRRSRLRCRVTISPTTKSDEKTGGIVDLGASGRSPAKTLSMITRRARVHGRRLAWRFGWRRSGDRSVLGCAVRASGGVAEPQRARV